MSNVSWSTMGTDGESPKASDMGAGPSRRDRGDWTFQRPYAARRRLCAATAAAVGRSTSGIFDGSDRPCSMAWPTWSLASTVSQTYLLAASAERHLPCAMALEKSTPMAIAIDMPPERSE